MNLTIPPWVLVPMLIGLVLAYICLYKAWRS